jgi:CheY-like chemotaxis protein
MVPMHILVVDDDGDVRDTIVAIRVRGYRVSASTEGWSMRDFLSGSDSVDGVVLDAVMPGEAGAGLALYENELLLPVVMISGSQEAMQFAIENGPQSAPLGHLASGTPFYYRIFGQLQGSTGRGKRDMRNYDVEFARM